jgi:hypothetical protein
LKLPLASKLFADQNASPSLTTFQHLSIDE